MPDFPSGATINNRALVSLSFRDWQGENAPVALDIPAASAANTAGIAAWSSDIADASNAALLERRVTTKASISPTVAVAFDEAQASVYQKATLVFQNEELLTATVTIPAPDASIFGPDRKTIDPTNTLVAAIITTTLVLLNGIGGADDTFGYVRGYSSSYSKRGSATASLPTIAEPETGDNPPPAPAEPAP